MNKIEKTILLFFGILYFLALAIRLFTEPVNAIMRIGIDLGIGAVIFLIYILTKNRRFEFPKIPNSFFELAIGLMIFHSLMRILPNIPLWHWNIGEIIRYNLICLLPIWMFTLIRRSPLWNFRQSIKTLEKDFLLFAIVFLILAIPSAFYAGTAQNILSGKIQTDWIVTLFSIGFLYNFFSAALPEEVFFRGFVQSRLSSGLKSKLGGLLISSIFFGVIHTGVNTYWGYGSGFLGGFSESIFIQTAFGLLYGTLYMRTGSLIPGILLHASGNSIINFADIASRLGLQ